MEKIRLVETDVTTRNMLSTEKQIILSNWDGCSWMVSAITELGTKIYPAQRITLDKAAQAQQLEQVTMLLNKPIGYVSGQPEPGYRPAVSLDKSRTPGSRGTAGRSISIPCI